MSTAARFVTALALSGVVIMSTGERVTSQEPGGAMSVSAGYATNVDELRQWDATVDGMTRTGELVVATRVADRLLARRVHEYLAQYVDGVPVHGGGVSRQLDRGVTVSLFGTIHRDIDLDTAPRLSPGEALRLIEQRAGTGSAINASPTLVILSHHVHGYVLAYRATMRDLQTWFLDAHDGSLVHVEGETREQGAAAVGVGVGIRGNRKKLSTSQAGGGFQAYDRLRPGEIVTLDLAHNAALTEILLDPQGPSWRPSNVASDADNEWSDAAVVDAHAYSGFMYDYLAARHAWHGMNGRNGRMFSMVNVGKDFPNAFFVPPPFGPEGSGAVVFGQDEGVPLVSLDVVGHEIQHGVTHFSVAQRGADGLLDSYYYVLGPSRFSLQTSTGQFSVVCGQRFRYSRNAQPGLANRVFRFFCREGRFVLFANHGGAINEAYSDMFGTAVEFSVFESDPSLIPDYTMGEDTGRISRSLENPRAIRLGSTGALRYPDAYSGLVRFLIEDFEDDGYDLFSNIGSVDGGASITWLPSFEYDGVHWNSTVLSHAFYLAIEGGRNKTTGRTVEGIGGANRADIERIFFRAMTDLMPPESSFKLAADAILQSAADLTGVGSAAYRAVDQALRAGGL